MGYPVKYAVVEKIERNVREAKTEIVGYMVNKVYVLSERKNYKEDGSIEEVVEVVNPISQINGERVNPEFNASNRCVNSFFVERTYDDYMDAKKDSEYKNLLIGNEMGKFDEVERNLFSKLGDLEITNASIKR